MGKLYKEASDPGNICLVQCHEQWGRNSFKIVLYLAVILKVILVSLLVCFV